MGKDWLHWIIGGSGGSRNSRSATKKEAAESASTGCMCAAFHLFHSHHLRFPPSRRNHSHSHPFLQEEAPPTTTGVEAPRNSLELEQENLNFPVGIIQIKTKPRFDEISSECNSPATKTPIVARLMGLDLLPQSTSPSISSSSPKCKRFLRRHDDDTLAARSLPETPRVSSSSSRRSVDERHRLSLQINEEYALFDRKITPARRGRPKQNENRNLVQRVVKHDRNNNTTTTTTRRRFGADLTNSVVVQSRRDENLLLHKLKPAKKNSNNQISLETDDDHDSSFALSPRILFSDKSKSKTTTSSSGRVPSSLKDCKRVCSGARCSSSSRLWKMPPRATTDRAVRGSRETNKLNLSDKILQVKKIKGPSPPPTKLPQNKLSQVSSKSRTQLSRKPSQSYNHTPPQTVSSCDGGGAALHGGSSPAQRNYIQIILKHTGIINHASPFAKWHTPSHPIDPGIFHHLEFSGAVPVSIHGGETFLSHGCNRKLVFQLVDELLAEMLTPRFILSRWVSPGGGAGGFPVVEELCKKIDSFPAAKCVVIEDIDSLIDTDLCKSRLNGCLGEEEEVVREIENEMVDWLVLEAVAVMGGDAAAEEITILNF